MAASYILIVDDDDEFREVVQEFLEAMDFEVRAAASLEAARPFIREGPAAAIVDWTLGDASGADVVALLSSQAPSCRILVATGYGATVTQSVAGQLDGVLRKPFKLKDLVGTLRTLVG